jgi:hypothetical protein
VRGALYAAREKRRRKGVNKRKKRAVRALRGIATGIRNGDGLSAVFAVFFTTRSYLATGGITTLGLPDFTWRRLLSAAGSLFPFTFMRGGAIKRVRAVFPVYLFYFYFFPFIFYITTLLSIFVCLFSVYFYSRLWYNNAVGFNIIGRFADD